MIRVFFPLVPVGGVGLLSLHRIARRHASYLTRERRRTIAAMPAVAAE